MWHESGIERTRFGILCGLLAACFLMGGASRTDVSSLLVLQPFAALCAAAFLLLPGRIGFGSVRIPLLLLAVLGAIMVAQLIPLPPALWTRLPGRALYIEAARVAGLPQPWRPMSLTPDLTMASLVGLIVPLAVLIGLAAIGGKRRHALLGLVLAGVGTSALFALGQVTSGGQGPLYLYEITNVGSGVGLFSNRNHQAVLLAMAWPMLLTWAVVVRRDPRRQAAVQWIAASMALFLLPLLLVTGSRAGLALAGLTLGACAILWYRQRYAAGWRRPNWLVGALGVGAALIVVGVTLVLSRAEAVQRLLASQSADDARIQATPVVLRMIRDFFPVGSGLGSFDPVFRHYEPLGMLGPEYLNHAHDDALELVLTAGLPGLVLLLVFVGWVLVQSVRAWRCEEPSADIGLARTGSVMICVALLSSIVDYPLRTPLMMALVSIACAWLGQRAEPVVGEASGQPKGALRAAGL